VRGAIILLLLAAAAAADPFAPKREELQIGDAAYARYVETLALLKDARATDPAGSLERAVALLEPFGLASQLEDPGDFRAQRSLGEDPVEPRQKSRVLRDPPWTRFSSVMSTPAPSQAGS